MEELRNRNDYVGKRVAGASGGGCLSPQKKGGVKGAPPRNLRTLKCISNEGEVEIQQFCEIYFVSSDRGR